MIPNVHIWGIWKYHFYSRKVFIRLFFMRLVSDILSWNTVYTFLLWELSCFFLDEITRLDHFIFLHVFSLDNNEARRYVICMTFCIICNALKISKYSCRYNANSIAIYFLELYSYVAIWKKSRCFPDYCSW